MTKAPPRRPTGPGSRSAAARAPRHLQVAAADDVLLVDGDPLPLRPKRSKTTRLIVWVAVPSIVLAGMASLFVVPTRSWLNQRRQYSDDLRKLEIIQAANAKLDEQIALLQTDDEIIRIARARYNLVLKGDQVMAVAPAPAPNPLPNVWPYTLLQDIVTIRLMHPESMPGWTPPSTVKPSPSTSAAVTNAADAPGPEVTSANNEDANAVPPTAKP